MEGERGFVAGCCDVAFSKPGGAGADVHASTKKANDRDGYLTYQG
ncbi:hypothetical protein [Streptomyces sp. NPDC005930]